MWFFFIIKVLCTVGEFCDVENLNNRLRQFLDVNDSITSVEDDLYKLFNTNNIDITISSDDGNEMALNFHRPNEVILPECLGRLININTLGLANNNLTKLPEYFINFTSLYSLQLSSNNFIEIPEILFSLKTLLHLYLKNNRLDSIKYSIERLDQLDVLDLSENNIINLTCALKKLPLLHLNLSGNRNIIRSNDNDRDIEKDIIFWNKLPSSIEGLFLRNIRLRYIPTNFNMPSLGILKLQNNFLVELPFAFLNCQGIVSLDVSYNDLRTIPFFVYHLKALKNLKLNDNKINSKCLIKKCTFPLLEKLDLGFCKIKEFEVEGYNMKYHYDILTGKYIRSNPSINENGITYNGESIPGIITSLKYLSVVITDVFTVSNLLIFPNLLVLKIVEMGEIANCPEVIGFIFQDLQKLQNLEYLEISRINFLILPKEIFTLTKLGFLALDFCQITEIPDELIALPNLMTMFFVGDNIENINSAVFRSNKPIILIMDYNPLRYLPSEINNNNFNVKLGIDCEDLEFFKKDDDNLGFMDISYKKISQIIEFGDLLFNFTMSLEDLYNKAHEGEYKWKLDKMLKIKNKEIKKHTKDYNTIMNYWNILENYIIDNNIKGKFRNYLQILYGTKRRRDNIIGNTIDNIKDNIRSYVEVVFEILTNLVNTDNNDVIGTILMTVEPGLYVCIDGQLQHFAYVYNLLVSEHDELNSIEYFIQNRIALLKYDNLREITTSNTEEQNVHIFLYWQSELSEILGLPFVKQHYGMHTDNGFLQSKEYILYQFFKLMNVKNVVKDLCNYINKTGEAISKASQYLYNNDIKNLKEYVEYEGEIEHLKITSITEKGIYFILKEMDLIEKYTASKEIINVLKIK